MSEPAPLPALIHKRDGRLVPFEPDKISQALFAATETLGHPDPFLARELTEGVLHFLLEEEEGAMPTTEQIAELVVKVVRELGQPALAQAFVNGSRGKQARVPRADADVTIALNPKESPDAAVARCLRAYSMHRIFSRDLAAAQQDGLLTLMGLEAPLQLAACVVGDAAEEAASPESRLLQSLEDSQELAQVLCLDSPDHALAGEPASKGRALIRRLQTLGRRNARPAVLNLGCAVPPPWASPGPAGPLFNPEHKPAGAEEVAASTDVLLDLLTASANTMYWRLDWHLGERDFASASSGAVSPRLLRLARLALDAPGLAFTLDRPRRPVSLGEGLDRKHSAVLLVVGLHLPRLLDLPGVHNQQSAFLQKLTTLGHLALSAAVQKRNYLREQARAVNPALSRGFLLDRARLVVVPVGLDQAVNRLAGSTSAEGKPAADLARQIIESLRVGLEEAGRRANLDSCIDGMPGSTPDFDNALAGDSGVTPRQAEPALADVSGLTPWAPDLPARQQLRAAGTLHAAAGGGTAAIFPGKPSAAQPRELAELLHFAWQQTEVVRLRFLCP